MLICHFQGEVADPDALPLGLCTTEEQQEGGEGEGDISVAAVVEADGRFGSLVGRQGAGDYLRVPWVVSSAEEVEGEGEASTSQVSVASGSSSQVATANGSPMPSPYARWVQRGERGGAGEGQVKV